MKTKKVVERRYDVERRVCALLVGVRIVAVEVAVELSIIDVDTVAAVLKLELKEHEAADVLAVEIGKLVALGLVAAAIPIVKLPKSNTKYHLRIRLLPIINPIFEFG